MLVGSYAPDSEGGSERQCRLLARELAARGHTVDVLTFRQTRRAPVFDEADGVRVRRFGWLGPVAHAWRRMLEFRLLRAVWTRDPILAGLADRRARATAFWLALPAVWLARLGFILELRRFAEGHPACFDAIHVHESGWLAGVGVALAHRWGLPVVCKEATAPALAPIGYDTPFRHAWDRHRRTADAWVAQTPAVAQQLSAAGIPPERVHRVPNGVVRPMDPADPASAAGVLYVGNLTQGAAWKAFDVLFDAWVRIARVQPDARLTVVGAGDPGLWLDVLRRGGAEASVRFTCRADDPAPFYRAAGIFVLPSRVEGMSNALLEAQSFGLACVVSDIPGNTAVVADGINGLVVPVGDAPKLAQALLRLLGNATLRLQLGQAARARMKSEYDIGNVTDRLEQIYQLLATRTSR
ncbi:MAG: glycosyltransferase family 4 protein [Kiritimatiellaeota bacterium]|nr:glycosyltransferase family 4 protein [Kiritimatiellota bacterium]